MLQSKCYADALKCNPQFAFSLKKSLQTLSKDFIWYTNVVIKYSGKVRILEPTVQMIT